jgi:hypothetical protein
MKDPFRRGLGYAIQWHDALRVAMNQHVDAALQASAKCIDDLSLQPNSHDARAASDLPDIALATADLYLDDVTETSAATHPNPHRGHTADPTTPTATHPHQGHTFVGAEPRQDNAPPTQPGPDNAAHPPATLDSLQDSSPTGIGPRTQCARILQQRCPACFAATTFGRSFNE